MAAIDLISKALWYRAKDLGTGSVTSWPDASGNSRTATLSGCTVATSSTPLGGKSVNGTTMAASVSSLGMIDGTYVKITAPNVTSFVPANLADGDAGTVWSAAAGFPITVQYRIRTAADANTFTTAVVNEYTVKNGGTAGNSPTAWTFQGSNDGSSWTTLHTVSGATTTANTATTHNFTNSTGYEYYKWVITANNSGGNVEWLQATLTGVSTGKTQLDGELWIVIKRDTANSTAWRLGTSGNSSHYDFSGTVYDDTGSTTRQSFTPSLAITSWRTYRVRVQGTNWTAYLDGNAQGGSSSSSTKSWQASAPAPFVGQSGWIAEWILFDHALDSGEVTTVTSYLTAEHFTAANTATATVTLAGTATPAGAATATGAVTLSGTATAAAGGGVATATASLTLAATATPKAATTATASLVLTGSTSGAVLAVVDVGVGVGPVTLEAGGAILSDAILATVACGVEVVARFLPSPVAPPLGVLTEWPLQRQAHLMAALSEANPRYRADIDYTVDRAETGRLHVFVGGEDYTYLRGVPAQFDDYSSSRPFESETARIGLPQLKPWDVAGTGDLGALDPDEDPAVEIALVRPDDSVEELWEGFLSLADDRSGTGEDYTFSAEGLFAQAAHQPWNPPPFMEPTDIGWLIADALNGVVARRWGAIPRVTTGILTRNRGTQAQSVWQYVQDLLSRAWTDDERQWTLSRVAAYTYRIVLKSLVTDTDFTVTKGAPGVDVALSQDQSQRHDCVFGRGIAPDGGVWGNWFFPGLDKFLLPLYPMAGFANMSVGTTNADTTTGTGVTDWQRRMRELGFPVTVDGVMNSADTDYVKAIQRKRGITVDGSLGPQTWAATFDNGITDLDLSAIRLPLAAKPDSEQYLYSANGAQQGTNPLFDSKRVRHAMPEVDFGPGVTKAEGRILAQRLLARDSVVGWSGTITLLTDPHESGTSRFEIRPGHNVHVVGHHGGVDLQVSAVSVSGLSVTLTVDSRARDAMTVDAILDRNRDAQRDTSARDARYLDKAALNRSDVTQYEAESQAGFVPRVAVNGNSGLWTVLPIFVSQVGVAKIEFTATEPKAELYVALFEKPITANQVASFAPDPSADSSGWFENVDDLEQKHGLLEVFGTPNSPGGYWPWEKSDGHALTGRLRDRSSSLYASQYGGFIWVAMFTSVSTWVQGRVFPAVPQ